MHQQGIISRYTLETIQPMLDQRVKRLIEQVQESLREEPALLEQEVAKAWLESLRVQRNTLMRLYHDNVINEETVSTLVAEIDMMLLDPAASWPEIEEKIEKKEEAEGG
jgi:hypothetical protein